MVNCTCALCHELPWKPLRRHIEELDDVKTKTVSEDSDFMERRYEKDKHMPVDL